MADETTSRNSEPEQPAPLSPPVPASRAVGQPSEAQPTATTGEELPPAAVAVPPSASGTAASTPDATTDARIVPAVSSETATSGSPDAGDGPAHRAETSDMTSNPAERSPVAEDATTRDGGPAPTVGDPGTEPATSAEPKSAADGTLTVPATVIGTTAQDERRRTPAPVAEPVVAEPVPPVPAAAAPVATAPTAPVAAPTAPQTVYVEAPQPPKKKSNRLFGVAISLVATLVFAALWLAVAAVIVGVNAPADRFVESLTEFMANPAYWVPVVAFFVGMAVLSLLINRGGWAWWLIFGLLVAALVYFGFLIGALVSVSGQLTPNDVPEFVRRNSVNPLAIGAAVVAREMSIWAGLIISSHGRRVKARNAEAHAAFERETAERKAEYERTSAGYAEPARS